MYVTYSSTQRKRKTLPVCHERSTFIEFVQCRDCVCVCFFRMCEKGKAKITTTATTVTTKPEKPFFFLIFQVVELFMLYFCVSVHGMNKRINNAWQVLNIVTASS